MENERRKKWSVWLKLLAVVGLVALAWLWRNPDYGPPVVGVIVVPLLIAGALLGLGAIVYHWSARPR